MPDYAYLVAFNAKSMETRQDVIGWLKERNAVHVLADVWFLNSHFPLAGDLTRELKRYQEIDGPLIVLKLNRHTTDWSLEGTSEDAESWVRANLSP